ncbi:lysylphosphatidylglycerol synthase domain-containing protein, partial [Burkholderia pseudomallei]
MTRWIKWLGWPIGIAILLALVVHEGAGDAVRVIGQAGFALLWLVPFHGLPLLLDAHAWRLLLDKRVSLPFLWWIATVREAVNRLLPVVGVGGEIVGIRLARWRVPDASRVTASVIVEVLVTIAVQYAFAALGLVLLLAATQESVGAKTIGVALALSLPIPVLGFVLMRRGGVFHAIERFAGRLLGDSHRLLQGVDGKRLDADIDALMSRAGLLFRAFFWQLAGYVAGALEIYWALAMLGHPISIGGAIAIEAMTQAVRHAAFMVPGGLGVQEATVVLLAQMFGVDREAALSLALVKRARELLFGALALGSWQVVELSRTRRRIRSHARRAARVAAAEARR